MILFDFILKIQSHENQCIISKLIPYNFFALSQTKTPSFSSPLDASRRVSQAIPETTSLGSIVMRLSWEDAAILRHSPSFFSHSSAVGAEEGDTGPTQSPRLVRRRYEGALLELEHLELSVIPSNCQRNSVWILDVTSNL